MSLALTPVRQSWLAALAALAVLGLIFTQEIASAVGTWNASTAYGHCWLVLPIVAWLLWERRHVVRNGMPRPALWPSVPAALVLAAWVVADWLGIMEGRQLAVIGFAELILLAAFGWRLWWALSPAFLYLLFLVPFGAFLTPALQRFTTGFILAGLRLFDVPFEADAFQITIPEGVFYVAEACAGLRFLIASVAFGVLYAVTLFRSPARRAAYIAVACIVPVLANGVRGLGIVLLGHTLGSAQAGAADHLIYGWVFFTFVIALLALAGLPFREDHAAARLTPTPGRTAPRAMLLACVPILALAACGPGLSRIAGATQLAAGEVRVPKVVPPANCTPDGSTHNAASITQTFRCGTALFRLTATTLAAGSNPARILEAGRAPALAGLSGNVDSDLWRTPSGAAWTILAARDTNRQAAYAIFLDGAQITGSLSDRLHMARDMLHPGSGLPVVVAVSLDSADPAAMAQLRSFLSAQGALFPQALPAPSRS